MSRYSQGESLYLNEDADHATVLASSITQLASSKAQRRSVPIPIDNYIDHLANKPSVVKEYHEKLKKELQSYLGHWSSKFKYKSAHVIPPLSYAQYIFASGDVSVSFNMGGSSKSVQATVFYPDTKFTHVKKTIFVKDMKDLPFEVEKVM